MWNYLHGWGGLRKLTIVVEGKGEAVTFFTRRQDGVLSYLPSIHHSEWVFLDGPLADTLAQREDTPSGADKAQAKRDLGTRPEGGKKWILKVSWPGQQKGRWLLHVPKPDCAFPFELDFPSGLRFSEPSRPVWRNHRNHTEGGKQCVIHHLHLPNVLMIKEATAERTPLPAWALSGGSSKDGPQPHLGHVAKGLQDGPPQLVPCVRITTKEARRTP
nr:uncharacterized protein LOC105497784 [Macaca nemestrina]